MLPRKRWVWLEDEEEEQQQPKVIESVLTLQEMFNRRSYDLSVQAARCTFAEVVVEIRENGEEEQVITVT